MGWKGMHCPLKEHGGLSQQLAGREWWLGTESPGPGCDWPLSHIDSPVAELGQLSGADVVGFGGFSRCREWGGSRELMGRLAFWASSQQVWVRAGSPGRTLQTGKCRVLGGWP